MNLFGKLLFRAARLLTPVPGNRGGWWSIVREPFTGAWQRNMEWTTDTVLAHHAVYACITRIAQDIGKLRPKLVELDTDGIWSETTSPAFSPVLNQPNRFQNYIQFQEWWMTSKLIHGNTYCLLERDGRGVVTAMYLLDPLRVKVLLAPDGEVFYELRSDNLAGLETDAVNVPASEVVHDRMNCLFHPLVGTSPIFACGAAANMGLSIQKNSTAFFDNGANPVGVLSTPGNITPQQAEDFNTEWMKRFGPGGSGGIAVLGSGMKFEPMTMTAQDSQLIEQLEWTAEMVCSAFHVPPFKIGVGQMPPYQSAEILNQIYYSECLQTHIENYELSLDAALGIRNKLDSGKTYGTELDLDGLLRMDSASQINTLKEAVGGSLLSINEARKKIDQKPKKGGESILSQQQYFSIEALYERDQNDPFAKAPTAPALPAPDAQKALPAPKEETTTEDRVASLRRRASWRARTLRLRTAA